MKKYYTISTFILDWETLKRTDLKEARTFEDLNEGLAWAKEDIQNQTVIKINDTELRITKSGKCRLTDGSNQKSKSYANLDEAIEHMMDPAMYVIPVHYSDWKNDWESNKDKCIYSKEYDKETKSMIVTLTAIQKEMHDFFPLYNAYSKDIGDGNADFSLSCSFYNLYSKEFGLNNATDLINKLYEVARENGKLSDDTATDETTETATVEEPTEVELSYRDYKNDFYNLKKVPDSYDACEKTIRVYMTSADKERYEDWKKKQEQKAQEEASRWQVVEMPYKEYKKSYSGWDKWDYNPRTGTIKVKIPAVMEYQPKDKHYAEKHEFKAGYTDELVITPKTINPDEMKVEIPEELKNNAH